MGAGAVPAQEMEQIAVKSASTLSATGMMERTTAGAGASLSKMRQVLGSSFVAPRPNQR